MMEKEFIPYEQALKLEELGFHEPCFATIDQTEFVHINGTEYPIRGAMDYRTIDLPTFSQAFRWFREKKISDSCICRYQSRDDGGIYYYYVINHDFGIEETKHFKEGFYTYEEAELACLNKLIEIVESNKE